MNRYFLIERGRYRYTKTGIPRFETDSCVLAMGASVADMMSNVANEHPDFFTSYYEGVTWKEMTKEQAEKFLGRDVDKAFSKGYGKRRKKR